MPKRHRRDETSALPAGAAAQPGWVTAQSPSAVPPTGAPTSAPAAALAADQAPESVVTRVRRHGRHLTLPVLVLIAVAAAGGYFIGWFPEGWMNLTAAAAAAVIAIFLGIGPILGWLAQRTVITTRRVIVHRGFFVRHRTEVSLARVREVRTKQNPIQRMWRSGNIDLLIGAEATRLADVPRVAEIHTALRELSERSYDQQMRASSFGYPSQHAGY